MLNLVFGSSCFSYMDCEVRCVLSVTIGLIGFVSNSAPSSMASSYMDVPFTVRLP